MKFSPKTTAFLQAVGLTLYVALFAFLAFRFQPWLRQNEAAHPVFGITLFLLTFVLSALISGSLILGYPLLLFFEGRKAEAVKIVLLSALWLALFLVIFLLFAIFFLSPSK